MEPVQVGFASDAAVRRYVQGQETEWYPPPYSGVGPERLDDSARRRHRQAWQCKVLQLLTGRGLDVRVLTRERARAEQLRGDHSEVVAGDVRGAAAVHRAMAGADIVISASQGLAGSGHIRPRSIDRQGSQHLIQAASAAVAEYVILASVHSAAPEYPMELGRRKCRVDQELQVSDLDWTIVRPTVFMETRASPIGESLLRTGRTRLFGRCENPINFVSATDVARVTDLAVAVPSLHGMAVEVGGPENLTLKQFAQTLRPFLAGRPSRGKYKRVWYWTAPIGPLTRPRPDVAFREATALREGQRSGRSPSNYSGALRTAGPPRRFLLPGTYAGSLCLLP